ncbi:tumor necrosis factor receptor superfamily member 5 [Discoglossus pictus]
MCAQFTVLLFLVWNLPCFAGICLDSQYEKYDKCCQKCPPGQYLSTECSKDNETSCSYCQPGEFQDKWNRETSCHLHAYCDPNAGFEQESEGTTEKDVMCRCQRGRHCSSQLCETCVLNTACAPGYGVLKIADTFSDTVCSPCANGTFSNITSDREPCRAWSRCSPSQQEVFPGSSLRDVSCSEHISQSGSKAAIYVLLAIFGLLFIIVLVWLLHRWVSRRQLKKNKKQIVILDGHHQVPVEDQDPALDITMQGHPVAQEQGKDSHISQEEV